MWFVAFGVAHGVWQFVWHMVSWILRGIWCVAFSMACGELYFT